MNHAHRERACRNGRDEHVEWQNEPSLRSPPSSASGWDLAGTASAQDAKYPAYPVKTVTLLSSSGPGGGGDVFLRQLVKVLGPRWGHQSRGRECHRRRRDQCDTPHHGRPEGRLAALWRQHPAHHHLGAEHAALHLEGPAADRERAGRCAGVLCPYRQPVQDARRRRRLCAQESRQAAVRLRHRLVAGPHGGGDLQAPQQAGDGGRDARQRRAAAHQRAERRGRCGHFRYPGGRPRRWRPARCASSPR